MKILFYLGHPAHYHLFKNTISELKRNNHNVYILIKKKDILEDLLKQSNFDYINILPKGRKDSKIGIALGLIKRDWAIFKFCQKRHPDIMIGTSAEITHVGKLMNIPSIVLNEDDYNVVPLFSNIAYPFATAVLSPISCNNGKWEYKSYKYAGFHKLAYLHPKRFKPEIERIINSVDISKPYFLLRFAKLTAHHDKGKKGISSKIAQKIIDLLSPYGNIYITSERYLGQQFEQYRLKINFNDIHHVLYYSSMYIGDSQSMAVEAALLGVPGIRFNDFVGKIGVLEELEHRYKLTYGVKTAEPEKLYKKIEGILNFPDLKQEFEIRRQKMLSEKIDVTAFIVWFIENYPKSVDIIKNNPDYQWRFK